MKKKLETVLIYPKVGDEAYAIPHVPLSVLAVASATEQKQFKVKIIDQRVDANWRQTLSESVSEDLICFGISSMTGPQLLNAIEIAEYLRQMSPDIPIVWGGVHPSLMPEQTLNSTLADIVVIKEGEETFPELLNALKYNSNLSSVNGIAFKDEEGKPIITSNREFCLLDSYSPLNYDLIDIKPYQEQGQERVPRTKSVSLFTSRGCTFKCTYCYNSSFHNCKWRGQSAEVVNRALLQLYDKGIRNIILCDEYFFQDLDRARAICRAVIDNNFKLRFYFVNCRLDQIKRMTDDDLKLFVRAGIKDLFIGIESGSREELIRIKKGIDLNYLEETCKRLLDKGMIIQFSFMLGIPNENLNDIKKTVKLMEDILSKYPEFYVPSPGMFIPFPGTESYERAIAGGWKPPTSLEEWGNIVSTVDCSDWLGSKIGKVAKQTAFFASAMDTKINPRSGKLLECVRRIYSKIAKLRARYGLIRFVPEYFIFQSPLKKIIQKKKSAV